MKPVVYLAGKMAGLDYKDMTGWRDKASATLRANGFEIMDPTSTVTESQFKELANGDNKTPSNEVVDNNIYQILHSDVILAELNFSPPSIGTSGEIIFSAIASKPVIAWGKSGVEEHPWIKKHLSAHRATLEEALEHIIQAYGGAR